MAELSPQARKWVRGLVDYGGLALFLVGALINHFDLLKATWWLVAGSAIGLLAGLIFERRLATMPLLAGGAALLFGGLTLVFHDVRFLKIKPTIINLAFAAFLLGGAVLKRNPLKHLIGEALHMTDAGWRTLTLRYGLYFLCIAGINELIWRTQSDQVWTWFRFPGLQILALAFSFSQVPLIMKSAQQEEAAHQTEEPAALDE
jgi:intracellular septation protein